MQFKVYTTAKEVVSQSKLLSIDYINFIEKTKVPAGAGGSN